MSDQQIIQQNAAREIKQIVAELNDAVSAAAHAGVSTEFMLDRIPQPTLFHQRVRVVTDYIRR